MALTKGAEYLMDLDNPLIAPVVDTFVDNLFDNIQTATMGAIESWIGGPKSRKGRDQIVYPKIV